MAGADRQTDSARGGLDLGKLKKDIWIKLLGIRTDSSMAGTAVHSIKTTRALEINRSWDSMLGGSLCLQAPHCCPGRMMSRWRKISKKKNFEKFAS